MLSVEGTKRACHVPDRTRSVLALGIPDAPWEGIAI